MDKEKAATANQNLEAVAKAKAEAAKAKAAYEAAQKGSEEPEGFSPGAELVMCLNELSVDVQELTDTVMAIAASVLGSTKAKGVIADRRRLAEERELQREADDR